jgi:hypothetical protein
VRVFQVLPDRVNHVPVRPLLNVRSLIGDSLLIVDL